MATMDPTPGPPPPSAGSAPAEILPHQPRFLPVASYLHTAALVAVLLLVGLVSGWAAQNRPPDQSAQGPLPQYLQTIAFQWIMFGLVVLGMRRRGVTIGNILGDRWKSFDDVLMDLGLAGATFVASIVVRLVIVAVVYSMWEGPRSLPNLGDSMKSIQHLVPHSPLEIGVAMLLALTAGFVEEFLFRGYLQRQFMALTQNVSLGILIPTAVFTVGHLYQDKLQLAFVAVLGLMLAILAHFRKNLRPGIILHTGQDMMSLLALSFLTRFLAK